MARFVNGFETMLNKSQRKPPTYSVITRFYLKNAGLTETSSQFIPNYIFLKTNLFPRKLTEGSVKIPSDYLCHKFCYCCSFGRSRRRGFVLFCFSKKAYNEYYDV